MFRASLFSGFAALTLVACGAVPDSDNSDNAGTQTDEIGTSSSCASTPNRAGWCWATKNHPAQSALRIAPIAANDVWATMGYGALLHYDGSAWRDVPIPHADDDYLRDVWAASKDDVWTVGSQISSSSSPGGIVYRFDGTRWREAYRSRATLNAVWGSGPNDVWMGGSENVTHTSYSDNHVILVHWDGASFTEYRFTNEDTDRAYPGFTRIHGTGPNDVWAVGASAETYHFDGTSWSSVAAARRSTVVVAIAPNDVWLGGDRKLLHYDGVTATPVALPAGMRGETTAIVRSGNDVLVGLTHDREAPSLFRWNGQQLVTADLPASQEGATSTSLVLASSSSGELVLSLGPGDLYAGSPGAWRRTTSGPQVDFDAILPGSGRTLIGGRAPAVFTLATPSGPSNGWSRTALPAGATNVSSFAGTPSAPVALGSGSFFAKQPDGSWQMSRPFPASSRISGALAGASSSQTYAYSDASVWSRQNGGAWAELPSPGSWPLKGLWTFEDGEVYASDTRATFRLFHGEWIVHWSHPVKALARTADGALWGIDSSATVGSPEADYVLRDDQRVRLPRDVSLDAGRVTSLTACPNGHLYGLGDSFEVVAFDGNTWRSERTGSARLSAIRCDAQNRVWAVGAGGVVVFKP